MAAKPGKNEKLILAVGMLIVAGLVWMVSWASRQEVRAREQGPDLLALDNQQRLWMSLNGEVHVLDPGGNPVGRFSATQLGVRPPLASIAALPEGGVIVGSRETGTLHFIRADGSPAEVLDPASTEAGRLFGAFHVVVDAERDVLVVTDTSHHRVIVMDRHGAVQQLAGNPDKSPGKFHFPNGVALDRSGRILVVDTNNHAIQILDSTLSPISTRDPLGKGRLEGFIWPVFVAVDGDTNVYVTNHDHNLEEGELVRLGTDGEPELRFPLQPGTRPSSFVVREHDVLLSDLTNFRILRFDRAGAALANFGSSEFELLLDQALSDMRRYKTLMRAGQIALVVILAALLALLYLARRRQDRGELEAGIEGAPGSGSAGAIARLKLGMVVGVILGYPLFLMMLVSGYLLALMSMEFETWLAGWLVIVAILVVPAGFSAIGRAVFAGGSRRGTFHAAFHARATTFVRRFSEAVNALVVRKERILAYALAMIGGGPALVILTADRIFMLSTNHFGSRLLRIQDLGYSGMVRPTLRRRYGGLKGWLLGIGLPMTRLSFGIAGLRNTRHMDFVDHVAAEEIFKIVVDLSANKSLAVGPAVREHCPSCRRLNIGRGHCPVCGPARAAVWRPALLSMILPGAGQFYNQELLKGGLFMAAFAVSAIPLMEGLAAYWLRTKVVNMNMLVALVITVLAVCLVAMGEAYATARRGRLQRWGLQ